MSGKRSLPPDTPRDVTERIRRFLSAAGCVFEESAHRSVRTAAEAAEARGTPIERGVKSILFKTDGEFGLFALRADRELSSRALRRALGVRRTRFASADELTSLTGLSPGSIPPFGRPVLPFPLYADRSIFVQPRIVFTAGSRTVSIEMESSDYRRVAGARVLAFSRPAEPDPR